MKLLKPSKCRRRIPTLVALLTVGALAWTAQVASAQMTVDKLLGDSIKNVPEGIKKNVEQAMSVFQKGKFDDARKLLSLANDQYPSLPPEGVLMAQMFAAANQVQAARLELERSVVETPGDPEPYLVFGDLAFQGRQVTEAFLCFEKAGALSADYRANNLRKTNMLSRSHAGLAAVASAREQYALAERHLEEWIKLAPDSTAAYTRLGRAQYKQGEDRHKDAYETFQKLYSEIDKASEPANKVARAEVNMAMLFTADKKLPNAKHLMQRAAERAAPDDLKTHVTIAQWAMEQNELSMAASSAKKAAIIDPKSSQAKLLVGMVARFQKDHAAAEKAFRAVLAETPSNFAAINNLALSLIEQPDESKRRLAVEYAQLNSRANPNAKTQAGREAAATLAWIFHRLGREVEAERAIVQVLQAGSVTNEAAYHAAKILNDRGRPDQAKSILVPVLNGGRNFVGRDDAKALLAKLGGATP